MGEVLLKWILCRPQIPENLLDVIQPNSFIYLQNLSKVLLFYEIFIHVYMGFPIVP